MRNILILLMLTFMSAASFGESVAIVGRVKNLVPSDLPGSVAFQMDAGTTQCPAGKFLKFRKGPDANKAIYSTLLAAVVSDTQIVFHYDSNVPGCIGTWMLIR